MKRRTKKKPQNKRHLFVEEVRIRDLNAINDVRKGKASSLLEAARKRGTTVDSIRRRFPAALFQDRRGGRIHVKPTDPYPALVKIATDDGPVIVTARNSRERELAGQHRATLLKVLRGDEPASSLRKFRGKAIDGQLLASRPERVLQAAEGGEFDHLEGLYVIPGDG
jgi:hypothetical protein